MSRTILERPRGGSRPVVAFLTSLAILWAATTSAWAQLSPEQSAERIALPEGLEATLFAAEPMVRNPTTIDVDSRGRVWVTEGVNYRLYREANDFDRIGDSDQIKILEDTDGDGRADKVTVFADRIFPVPMGIAIEERYDEQGRYTGCRVFVGNSPRLMVFEDTDGDDRADRRYALLEGFGGVDSDHGVHGMVLGLDGKLYFTHGDGCCSVQGDGSTRTQNFDVEDRSGRRVQTDQLGTTLRVNRDGTQFEILADRQRNNYETYFDSFGALFTSDNDDDGNRGCRVIWIMDGATYGYRTPGSPRHWGEDVPGNTPKLVGTGNGSPSGIMRYEGNLLPERFQGAVFEVDAGTRQINSFPITRTGASYRTEADVLLSSDDAWFRPVDVTAAPDGSLFVADWYDAGVGGHRFVDQTTGRIYRVAPPESPRTFERPDMARLDGLIAALQSPVVATRDAAQRSLIVQGEAAVPALRDLFERAEPIFQARALWTLHAILGDPVAVQALNHDDLQIRELAVRILGRDVSRVGDVSFEDPEARFDEPAAKEHLDALLGQVDDPDAGVRRELILAFRDLPTDLVGEALRRLTAAWDGQDRWYLQALGLALEDREGDYIAALLEDEIFGLIDPEFDGLAVNLALPPYFPTDRNEAYIPVGSASKPSTALTKSLGLAWRLHRPEVLSWLGRVLPSLQTPELQQAADDIILQIEDPAAAPVLAGLALDVDDSIRRRQVLRNLRRQLEGPWKSARGDDQIRRAVEIALDDPRTRPEAIRLVAAIRDRSRIGTLRTLTEDPEIVEQDRIAAIDALTRLQGDRAVDLLEAIIDEAIVVGATDPRAEAAVRNLVRLSDGRDRLRRLFLDDEAPLALRREALRSFAASKQGAFDLLGMVGNQQLPDILQTEALTATHGHPDRGVRRRALEVIPLPESATGRPLPSIQELAARVGDPVHGRAVFYRDEANACASCHRVQGRGRWVGPDLSTIGTKYGRAEMFQQIINPNAAIGYNYRTHILALDDGRILSGLIVDESPAEIVLKTAEGRRIAVEGAAVEERRVSEISLMPEGLAQTMTDDDLVDLLAFLDTLRQPVSVVGEASALGPLTDIDLSDDASNPSQPWRRLRADAEGRIDLSDLTTAGTDDQVVLLAVPVTSPLSQSARLVLEVEGIESLRVEVADRGFDLTTDPQALKPIELDVDLPRGTTRLLVKLPCGTKARTVLTFVADHPIGFEESAVASGAERDD